VVGDGPLRAPLEELAARLRISWAVHFAGWVASEQLPRVLAGIDIVVHTGQVLETFCIANIEVMSMGIPLVTFAVGGVGEYVLEPPLPSFAESPPAPPSESGSYCATAADNNYVDGCSSDNIAEEGEDRVVGGATATTGRGVRSGGNHNGENSPVPAVLPSSTDTSTAASFRDEGDSKTVHFTLSRNAVIVNSATPPAVAAAVGFLIQHPHTRKAIGNAGRETVIARYSVQRQMEQYSSLYLCLLQHRNECK
jgi:glycosyltransferase involved in cell wall biosynthesis